MNGWADPRLADRNCQQRPTQRALEASPTMQISLNANDTEMKIAERGVVCTIIYLYHSQRNDTSH